MEERDDGELRRELEAALRASEARYQAIFQGARDAIFVADASGRLLDANLAGLRMLGRTIEEVRAMSIPDLHPPEELETALAAFATHLREPEKDLDQLHVLRSDGARIPVEIGSALAEVNGRVINIGTFRDITRRQTVDKNLQFQLSIQQAMTRIAASLADTKDRDRALSEALQLIGELAHARRAVLFQIDATRVRLTHYWASSSSDAPEDSLVDFRAETLPYLGALLRAGKPFVISSPEDLPADALAERAHFAEGRRAVASVPLMKSGTLFGSLAVHGRAGERRTWSPEIVDALGLAASLLATALERLRFEEERRRLELQLQHAQKLESLGVLAGGIAHDFNNLLVAILGNLDLALQDLAPCSPAIEQLRDAELAARRAAELTRQMLAYSGRGRFVVGPVELGELVEEMVHILQVSVSKKAALRLELEVELPAIEADAVQLRQVVMNLVINASEAIGDATGVISVSTGRLECDRGFLAGCWIDDGLDPGHYIYLEVADSGCGMDSEQLKRIFDPFYTTKFTGRGLGLAAVLGIVRGHRGAIRIDSTPGKGTRFRVLFPAARQPPIEATAPPSTDWRGSGFVLLVDDEEVVRTVGKRILERLGFEVLLAVDGLDAIELFRARQQEIALVILDLTMPRMDGTEAYRELCRLRPEVRVLVTSGYAEQDVEGRFSGANFAGFLQKPFQLATVAKRVRAALEDGSTTPTP